MEAKPPHSRAGIIFINAGKALAGACLMLMLGVPQAAKSADPETAAEAPPVEMPAQAEPESGVSLEPLAEAETPDKLISKEPEGSSPEDDRPAEAQDVSEDSPTGSPDVAAPQPTSCMLSPPIWMLTSSW